MACFSPTSFSCSDAGAGNAGGIMTWSWQRWNKKNKEKFRVWKEAFGFVFKNVRHIITNRCSVDASGAFPMAQHSRNRLQYRKHGRGGFDPLVRKDPWRRVRQPTPVFLPGEIHGQSSLMGYSPSGSQRAGHDWATEHVEQCPHVPVVGKGIC